ncbi:MAG TPA: hypothetical protein VFR86_15720 [Burkholderiaceae bacterium]|nr:hypothetical protein [Burkholderiaceae bacterium]
MQGAQGALEVNAHSERLDLLDVYCRMVKDEGVSVASNSDAHSVHEFDNLAFGVGQARRGWIGAGDVINTRPLRKCALGCTQRDDRWLWGSGRVARCATFGAFFAALINRP